MLCYIYLTFFIFYSNIDINDIKLQLDEVSEIKWCTKSELDVLIKNEQIVPHIREFEILNKILK